MESGGMNGPSVAARVATDDEATKCLDGRDELEGILSSLCVEFNDRLTSNLRVQLKLARQLNEDETKDKGATTSIAACDADNLAPNILSHSEENMDLRWITAQEIRLYESVKSVIIEKLVNDMLAEKEAYIAEKDKLEDRNEAEVLAEKIEGLAAEIVAFPNNWDDKLFEKHINIIDWDTIASKKFRGVKSGEECKRYWYGTMVSSHLEQPWSRPEIARLQNLVSTRGHNDWEAVSKLMNSKHNAYQCMRMYYLTEEQHKLTWTKAENQRFYSLLSQYKDGDVNWSKVTMEMHKKLTEEQARLHWNRTLDPNINKRRFTTKEDAFIVACVLKYGPDFSLVASLLPGRSVEHVKRRYCQKLMQHTAPGQWTLDDDRRLLQAVEKFGHDWATMVRCFPGRTKDALRCRHKDIKTAMAANPGVSLEKLKLPKQRKRPFNKNMTGELDEEGIKDMQRKLKVRRILSSRLKSGMSRRKTPGDFALQKWFSAACIVKKRGRNRRKLPNEQQTDLGHASSFYAELLEAEFDIPDAISEDDFQKLHDNTRCFKQKRRLSLVQLEALREGTSWGLRDEETGGQIYLPPDRQALLGIRTLLLQRPNLRDLAAMSGPIDDETDEHAEIFSRQMVTLFTLPAIMSKLCPAEQEPSDEETPESSEMVHNGADIPDGRKKRKKKMRVGLDARRRMRKHWRQLREKERNEEEEENVAAVEEPPKKKRKYAWSGKYTVRNPEGMLRRTRSTCVSTHEHNESVNEHQAEPVIEEDQPMDTQEDYGDCEFLCGTCNMGFKTTPELCRHLKLMKHVRDFSYRCITCGNRYTEWSSLKRHKMKHLDQFRCDECGDSFDNKEDLDAHCATHTTEAVSSMEDPQ